MTEDPGVAKPEDLLVEVQQSIATLTLNRPDTLNALSAAHLRQLASAFEDVSSRKEVRVIVLTGAGRAFCAGGDLRTLSRDVVLEAGRAMLHTLSVIRRSSQPVVAMVNGDAVGGGNEIVIACDLAVAAESARLGQAGTRLGWAPIAGATNFLSQQIGDKRAREVIFFSRIVSAQTALEWGWINRVMPDAELQAFTMEWCRELVERSPGGLRLAKAASNFWWDLSYAAMTSALAMMSADLTDEVVSEGNCGILRATITELADGHVRMI